MRKIIHTAIILMSLLLSNHLVAQDTITFTYDPNNNKLTIKTPCTWGFPKSEVGDNKTLQALRDAKTDGGKNLMMQDIPNCYPLSDQGLITAYCKIFDSIEISKSVLYETDDANKLIEQNILKKNIIIYPLIQKKTDNTDIETNNGNAFVIILVTVVVILLVGCVILLFSRRKKKEKKTTLPKTEVRRPKSNFKIIKTPPQNRTIGLDHIKGHEDEYYLLDMQKQYDETTIHKIYLHHTVVKKTYDFFKTFLESANRTPETGCFFIGCWEYADESNKTYNISLEDIVEPGDDIEPDEYSFNFGYKIGGYLDIKIRNLREKTGRDYVHTVWMHSHPGIGLFLSSQDLVVQDLLKNKKESGRLAAFVIDTNSSKWDFAVFTTKMNGDMNNQSDMKYTYSLDELYGWSRKIHSQNEKKDFDNYYKIELNDKGGNGFAKLYLSGKVINHIDGILYDTKDGVVAGSLSGCTNSQDNWCCIEELTKTSDTSLGTIIVDSELSYEMIFTKYEESIRESLVVIIFRSDEELWICSRKDTNCQFVEKEKITSCTLGQLREWIRRKRV